MVFATLLVLTLTSATEKYYYCQEYWQSDNCMSACDTRYYYGGECGNGDWCRCGYCEKVWSQARAVCVALWYASGDCADDECCDYSAGACVDVDSSSSTSASASDLYTAGKLEADSTHWGTDAWTGAAPEAAKEAAKESSKVLPTILVLSAIVLLGVFGFVGLKYAKSKRAAAELEKNMSATVYGTGQPDTSVPVAN